jgi:RNA polymerase sigma-70 factor (ECF subfamily)
VQEVTPAERRLEAVVTAHGSRVLAYLTRRTSPVEDAADVYQEVVTTVWRKIHEAPEDEEHCLAWLLSIARRTLSNHRRATRRRHEATQRLRGELAAYRGVPVDGADPAVDAVRAALVHLAPDDREVLALTYWEGLTSEQVATVLDASPAATRKRLQRARSRLEAVLAVAAPAQPPPRETLVRHGSQSGERALTGQ